MIYTFIYAASIIVTFILTALVLLGGVKNKVNLYFSLFLLSVVGWIGSLYLFYNLVDPNLVLVLGRFNFAATVILITLVFSFSYVFPLVTFKLGSIWKIAIWGETILLSLITLLTPFIDKEEIISGESRVTVYGPLYFLFIFHFIFYFIASIVILYSKYKKLSGIEGLRVRYVFFGLGTSILFGSVTNIFIPLFTKYYDSQNLGVIAPVILAGFITFAIRKHNLLDIKVIATEVLTFVIWAALSIKLFFVTSIGNFLLDLSILILTIIFGLLLIRSVTKEVQQREKLEDFARRLKEIDAQKDVFISMAAHELRAPMTAIKGYVSMVLEGDTGDIPEKARGFLADANNINDRLIRLVNNMLNVSRIEEGRMVYQIEEENLSQVVRAVFSQFAPEAERKGLEYKLEITTNLKDRVKVDPDRVQEIIGNLLSNAVKYTDAGFVKVKMVQSGHDYIRVEVIDSGPGISKEEQSKLFQKFHRVESNVGKTTGTGLGLYICKLLVEKFDGRMGVDSEVGSGSKFWFELPLVSSTS